VRAIYSEGGVIRGGAFVLRDITAEEFSLVAPVLTIVFDREAASVITVTGDITGTIAAKTFENARVRLEYVESRWRVEGVTGLVAIPTR
jgi:hypothetical protein